MNVSHLPISLSPHALTSLTGPLQSGTEDGEKGRKGEREKGRMGERGRRIEMK